MPYGDSVNAIWWTHPYGGRPYAIRWTHPYGGAPYGEFTVYMKSAPYGGLYGKFWSTIWWIYHMEGYTVVPYSPIR